MTAVNPLLIRKVAVLGAGVMGAQIAAHLINAKVPVVLFDLPSNTGPKSAIAIKAIENLKKLSPAPFCVADDVKFIEAANYEDDLDRLAQCDLVIEAIAERMDWKHQLYQRIASYIRSDAIFASNTSGLSITELSSGLEPALQPRFCGVHFFNPPRYMHLVELIPTAATRADILDHLEAFLTSTLGKGVVRAFDTPNFIANRVGIFSILAVMHEAAQAGIGFDLVDDLTGTRLGRAKSATFRTADVVGLDTMAHVIKTMRDALAADPFFDVYQTPAVLGGLIAQGALGQKTGAGFYRKDGRAIKVLEPANGQYVDAGAQADPQIVAILKLPPAERLRLLRETEHPQARFLWAIYRDLFHYVAVHLESIAANAGDLDLAVRWGFGWNEGPFESWQAAGWQAVAGWVQADIDAGLALSKAPLPAWVFAGPVAQQGGVHGAEGSFAPREQRFVARSALPVYARQVFRAPLLGGAAVDPFKYGDTLFEDDSVRAWIDPRADRREVVVVSFKTKMNTMGQGVIAGMLRSLELAEHSYRGMVIWQPTSLKLGMPGGPFSAGANLEEAVTAFATKGVAGIEPLVVKFQQAMLRIKYAQVPVIVAISGIALGGACELSLHCARRVAHVESYLGLVEAGVGLLPAGGGLKEMVLRAADAAQLAGNTRYLDHLIQPFMQIAQAKVSGSAHEARRFGYLQAADPIVFNVHELLDVALHEAAALHAAGYRPPLAATQVAVAGRSAIATLEAQLVNLRDGHFISAHDFAIARHIAAVICGGEVEAGSRVDEAWLLALERRGFAALLATPQTQERISGTLRTGKPVRN